MAIIKCKMCGGDIVLNEEKTFGTCEYCGSTMTLPKVSNEQRAARFNRGNHFRRQGDFDNALAVYESIVREDDNDAEAHWCCALCRFGIEYVEDPNTFEYLPTCHRASFDSFLEDVDYLAALEHSDGITRRQYQKDAAKIAEVQKGILATSQNEEPFDVFICYKETDDATKKRTRDSIDAQEIYYQLTQEGYRVFFSRITLEDKVGTEYEPYIFAALNSAKVMVAIGSKPEYFNAVWVKNEWSRFLALMRKDRSKLLLPCYKNLDPYELPEQLGVLQSYDMTKIGFMQDLIRGIKKVLHKDKNEAASQSVPQQVVVRESSDINPSISNLLRRGSIFLEEKNWSSAEEYFNKVLDLEAENGRAYLGLALAQAKCSNLDAMREKISAQFTDETEKAILACPNDNEKTADAIDRYAIPVFLDADSIRRFFSFHCSYPSRVQAAEKNKILTLQAIQSNRNLSRANQYADAGLKKEITEFETQIMTASNNRCINAQRDAIEAKEKAIKFYQEQLNEAELAVKRRYEETLAKLERYYIEACTKQKQSKSERDYLEAEAAFTAITDYKDSKERAVICHKEASEYALLSDYENACRLQATASTASQFQELCNVFQKLGEYKDCKERYEKSRMELKTIHSAEEAYKKQYPGVNQLNEYETKLHELKSAIQLRQLPKSTQDALSQNKILLPLAGIGSILFSLFAILFEDIRTLCIIGACAAVGTLLCSIMSSREHFAIKKKDEKELQQLKEEICATQKQINTIKEYPTFDEFYKTYKT